MSSASPQRSHGRPGPTQRLQPRQQPSRLAIQRSSDFRAQRMLKCPEICHFHTLAEFFHAALLEGDPAVELYVPQPFRLRFGRSTYFPDIYYVRAGEPVVAELKPDGEFDEALRRAASDYFAAYDTTFLVIANEEVIARAMEAQNWLKVVRWLLSYPAIDTEPARLAVLDWLWAEGEITYGQVADLGHRATRLAHECAVHRMLHSGEIVADFDRQFLTAHTRLWLC